MAKLFNTLSKTTNIFNKLCGWNFLLLTNMCCLIAMEFMYQIVLYGMFNHVNLIVFVYMIFTMVPYMVGDLIIPDKIFLIFFIKFSL